MNLIVMGDSVGIQLSVLFQDVASNGSLLEGTRAKIDCIPSMQDCRRDLYTLSRARGGGTVAGWRITKMLKEAGLTGNLPNHGGGGGGGWRLEMAEQMRNFSWDTPPVSESPNRTTTTNSTMIGAFDIMFFRIPQIWMSLDEVQHETLRETVEQAAKSFGVKTVIFMDLPIVNGYVKTTALVAANQRVRSFVDQWQHNRTDNSLTNVFLLELGTFMISVGTKNAEHLGYNTSQPDFIAELVPYDKKKYKSSAAINCLMMPSIDAKFGNYTATCPLNMLFNDGLHMCTETLGPRIVAGVGCLVNCASLDPSHHADCDRVCNQEHMQLDMEKTAPVSER